MSIINKMLQDLEQRQAGDATTNNMSSHVRAAPRQQSTPVAWLIAGLSLTVLCGVLIWLWLRPTPVAPAPQLVLKPSLMLQNSPKTDVSQTGSADSVSMPAAPPPKVVDIEGDAVIKPLPAPTEPKKEVVAPTTEKPSMPVLTAPLPAPVANENANNERVKTSASSTARREAETQPAKAAQGQALVLDKQVKQFTPQQRAENDARRALDLAQQGRVPEAITLLDQVLQMDASNAEARQTLIALLLHNKRQDDAARRAQEGLTLDVKQTGFAMILARLQVEKGEQKIAVATLQRSLPYAADNADYQAFLAALLQRENRHKEAIEQYVSALRKVPENSLWWMGFGISLQAEKRLPEAREAFTRAHETGALSPELQAFVEQKLKQIPR